MAATGKTQPYQFPYPEDDNPVDVSGDIALLAEAVNNKIDGIIVDVVGLMVTNNNVETGINVIFDDTNSNIDFVLDLNYIKNNVATMFDHEDHIGVNAVYDTVNKQINLEVTGGGGSGGTGTSSLTTSWWLGV